MERVVNIFSEHGSEEHVSEEHGFQGHGSEENEISFFIIYKMKIY